MSEELIETGKLNNDFKLCLQRLMTVGLHATPRGTKTRELLNYNISIFDPRNRIITFEDRKTSLKYLLGEFIWYISGSNNPNGIIPYAKFWDGIKNPDGTVNSNYGHRFFGHDKDTLVERSTSHTDSQWGTVVDILKKDPDSRQAIMNVHLPKDRWVGNKDIPCTLSLQFFIRENRLHLIVNMRSNDIILGFTNDVFQFTMLQEVMALELRETYPDLELGAYFHNAGSMHIYDRHFDMADKIIADDQVLELSMIPMDACNDVILTGLVGVEAAWQHAGAMTDFAFEEVPAWNLLTPYWKNLVKMCFAEDDEALHYMFGIPEDH